MPIQTLEDLFKDELADVLNAERQLEEALPKMAENASDEKLAEGFRTHLEETKGHIERIEKIIDICGLDLPDETCNAMQGLIKEGEEMIAEIEDKNVLDAALITAAQKVEHYEIASYGSLCALAKCLEFPQEATDLLQETLAEEKETDEKLSRLAEQDGINEHALKKAA